MEYKVMMPAAIWQGYDPNGEALEVETKGTEETVSGITRSVYVYTALTAEDGKVRVQTEVFRGEQADNASPVVLIVQEYHRPPEREFLEALAKEGYIVVVPDISHVAPDTLTEFPKSLSYGEFARAGDHIRKVLPTAKETCQYLYSLIVKRAVTFIKRNISDGKLVLMGMGDAVEVEIQVAGSGCECDAVACLNGAGYREYIRRNRYGGDSEEIVMDEERMCWLTGVASVAYAKYVKAPTFIALGSNARRSDIDRLSNLKALLTADSVHIVISPRAGDFLLPEAYESLLIWLHAAVSGTTAELPDIPDIDLRVNEDGRPYFDVDCDTASMIKDVHVFYACKDYNHEVRDWKEADCLTVSYNEYLASAESYDEKEPLFAFASVEYENGFTLSSIVAYAELKGLNVKPSEAKATGRIVVVYQAGDEESGFVEDYDGAVLMHNGLKEVVTSKGMRGLTSAYGGLRTYHFQAGDDADNSRILKLEFASDTGCEVTVSLIGISAEGATEYAARDRINATKGLFVASQFNLVDFKDPLSLKSPTSWSDVRVLVIRGDNLVVGNILFI